MVDTCHYIFVKIHRTPRVNHDVNYELRVMMCQLSFIICDKCTTLEGADSGTRYACVGADSVLGNLCTFHSILLQT